VVLQQWQQTKQFVVASADAILAVAIWMLLVDAIFRVIWLIDNIITSSNGKWSSLLLQLLSFY